MAVPVSYYFEVKVSMKMHVATKSTNLHVYSCFPTWITRKVSRYFGPRYIGNDFFLGPNLVSFNRTIVPYEISKVNFRVETQNLVSMQQNPLTFMFIVVFLHG
jgi:hypothetical protein